MSCRDLLDLITDYLEDALPRSDRLRLEDHLGECSACARYLEQMQEMLDMAGRIEESEVPPAAMDLLMNVFSTWRSTGPETAPGSAGSSAPPR